MDSAKAEDAAAPILSLNAYGDRVRLLDELNIPETGYG
jgi:hypothetical protein